MTVLDVDPRPNPTDRGAYDAEDLRPSVAASPNRSRGLWLIIGGATLLGLLAFLLLFSRRDATAPEGQTLTTPDASVSSSVSSLTPPADLIPIPAAVPVTQTPSVTIPAPTLAPVTPSYAPPPTMIAVTPAPSTEPTLSQRRSAPMLIVDLSAPATRAELASEAAEQRAGSGPAAGQAGSTPAANTPAGAAAVAAAVAAGADPEQAVAAVNASSPAGNATAGLSGDEQFAARLGNAEQPPRVRATPLRNPGLTVPQGALIPGVLETALNSDLPGYARAVVSRDVRSFDGSQVVIPRGSRVIGQYKSGLAEGQSRAFIIWERIIRSDGASIQIASSGTDDLGRAGLAGRVDRKFLQRFGGAILTSVLSAGVAAVSQQPTTSISIGGAGAGGVNVTPSQISPTIKVPQGAPIRIFVARDLDFSPVGGVR